MTWTRASTRLAALQGGLLFLGSITTGPDGVASATLTLEDPEEQADYDFYDFPLSLSATAPSGEVVLAQLQNLRFLNPLDPDLRVQATVRTDHSAAAPGMLHGHARAAPFCLSARTPAWQC